MSYLEQAVNDGRARITTNGDRQRIEYVDVAHTEVLSDPEERVRAEFWAELIYRHGYPPGRIGIEVRVPDRVPHDAADLVVFSDDARTRPFAVIECKSDGVSDTEFAQAVEQVAGNGTWSKFRAHYIGVVAGLTRHFLDFSDEYGVLEREANIIADLPQSYGKPLEYKYTKGGPLDIAPVDKGQLIQAIRKCHQTLWGGGRLSPPAAFGELCKIIFVKISDEKKRRKRGEPYEFQIRTHETSRQLAARVRALYEVQQKNDPDVFAEGIRISDGQLRTIVSHLESINLTNTDLDTKGLAFEQFMDGFFKGDFGQYFTPREIIDFAVDVLDVQPEHRVIDPACGSGGFLLHALDHVRDVAGEYFEPGTAEHDRVWHDFAQQRLFGIEINDEIARVAKMNMILHDDGHTNVVGHDALEDAAQLTRHNRGLAFETFDIVLTNPPFGAQISRDEHPYLASFELAHDERGKLRKSQRTEVLFLERVASWLKPGVGRAAVVVPDGVLTNATSQQVRDWLIEQFQLLAVVSLPASAFAHFGAGVKASVVFLRKRAADESPDPKELVFMAAADSVGYDATGRVAPNDLPRILDELLRFMDDPSTAERL